MYMFLGRFSIKDVVPSKEGESSKIKVKVRLDIHGVLNVVNASLVEKLAVAPEPEQESMEVEGQDEKAKETTDEAASEVELLDLPKLLTCMSVTCIAVLITWCIVHRLFLCKSILIYFLSQNSQEMEAGDSQETKAGEEPMDTTAEVSYTNTSVLTNFRLTAKSVYNVWQVVQQIDQGWFVQKPDNANPGLQVNWSIDFCCIKMVFRCLYFD